MTPSTFEGPIVERIIIAGREYIDSQQLANGLETWYTDELKCISPEAHHLLGMIIKNLRAPEARQSK